MFTGNFGQLLNKWTWGLFNTFTGNMVGHTLNIVGAVDNVTHLDGAVALSGITSGSRAFTISNYIFGPDNFQADWRDHLFVHEYGHYVQSQWFGSLYLPIVASTSVASALGLGGGNHRTRWFEVQASRMGAEHFEGTGFNRNSFERGGATPYFNQRKRSFEQGRGFPTTGARFSVWDIVVPIISPLALSLIF